jgi:hypothetical protein
MRPDAETGGPDMSRLLAIALTILGFAAFAGNAGACPASASVSTSQQTVMTGSAQTPTTTKPGG